MKDLSIVSQHTRVSVIAADQPAAQRRCIRISLKEEKEVTSRFDHAFRPLFAKHRSSLRYSTILTPDTKAMEMIDLIKDVLCYTNDTLLPTTSTRQLLTEDASRQSSQTFILDSGVVHPYMLQLRDPTTDKSVLKPRAYCALVVGERGSRIMMSQRALRRTWLSLMPEKINS